MKLETFLDEEAYATAMRTETARKITAAKEKILPIVERLKQRLATEPTNGEKFVERIIEDDDWIFHMVLLGTVGSEVRRIARIRVHTDGTLYIQFSYNLQDPENATNAAGSFGKISHQGTLEALEQRLSETFA